MYFYIPTLSVAVGSNDFFKGGVDMAAFFNRNYLIIKNINNDYQIFNIEKKVMGVFVAFNLT